MFWRTVCTSIIQYLYNPIVLPPPPFRFSACDSFSQTHKHPPKTQTHTHINSPPSGFPILLLVCFVGTRVRCAACCFFFYNSFAQCAVSAVVFAGLRTHTHTYIVRHRRRIVVLLVFFFFCVCACVLCGKVQAFGSRRHRNQNSAPALTRKLARARTLTHTELCCALHEFWAASHAHRHTSTSPSPPKCALCRNRIFARARLTLQKQKDCRRRAKLLM